MSPTTVAVRNVPRWMLWLPVDPLVLDRWGVLWPLPGLFYAGKWAVYQPIKLCVAALALWWAIAGPWWLGLFPVAIAVGLNQLLGSPGKAASGLVGRSYRRCQVRGKLRRHWARWLRRTQIVTGEAEVPKHGLLRRTGTGLVVKVHHGRAVVDSDDITDGLRRLTGLVGGLHSVAWRPANADFGRLYFNITDPLAGIIRWDTLPVAAFPRVCLGRASEGNWFTPTLLGRHILIVGQTRAGKSSLIWDIVAGAERWDTPPQWWVLDPKMGVELAAMDPERGGIATVYEQDPRMADRLFQQLHAEVVRRGEIMRAHDWKTWTPERAPLLGPLIFCLVDELLGLPDKALRASSYLRKLLQLSGAAGVQVIANTQLPQSSDDALGRISTMFNGQLVGATRGPGMTASAFGTHETSEAPAHKLLLPHDAGIFFSQMEGVSGYVKFKAGFVDDEHGEQVPIGAGKLRQPKSLGETLGDVVEAAA